MIDGLSMESGGGSILMQFIQPPVRLATSRPSQTRNQNSPLPQANGLLSHWKGSGAKQTLSVAQHTIQGVRQRAASNPLLLFSQVSRSLANHSKLDGQLPLAGRLRLPAPN